MLASKNVQILSEFHSHPGYLFAEYHRFIIMGGINVDLSDANSAENLRQFMTFPTHSSGHILDHLITSESFCLDNAILDWLVLSDHFMVAGKIGDQKKFDEKQTSSWSVWKDYDSENFVELFLITWVENHGKT